MPIFFLSNNLNFPSPDLAEENGLLAAGGDLSPERLIQAYRSGVFPWYNPGEPILWWSPDPRFIIEPERFHVPRRLARTIRQDRFKFTIDAAFEDVIRSCSALRNESRTGTWLSPEMVEAYIRLYELGIAHSAEVWAGDELSGGLYGIVLGKVFFGESMFSIKKDASKTAFVNFVRTLFSLDCQLIDCQLPSRHLAQFGAMGMPRKEFISKLKVLVDAPSIILPSESIIKKRCKGYLP